MKYTKSIRASRRVRPATRPVSASRSALRRRAIKADEEFEDIEALPEGEDVAPAEGEVNVDAEASELLFQAEDVAELISEVSGQPVDVTADENEVVFTVGEDEYTVTPDGDEEIVEESKRVRRGQSVRAGRAMRRPEARRPMARRVSASRRATASRRVAASRRVSATRRPRR
jgi:hypothetical protein